MRIEVLPEGESNSPGVPGMSPSEVVMSVRGVSKKFCRSLKRAMFYALSDIGGELAGLRTGHNRNLRKDEFWALQDISFELKKGDAMGLVGANGAGKTTLLKIVTGLIKPDKGSVQIQGRIAPLIALGAGFNPILSGRENIYINMAILGLTRQQIDDRLEEVIEFAEIGHAIDAPVQTYSSGMGARLGFACAIHTDPDILLIDEVLAVGDVKFRMKCYRKLSELKAKGVAFLLVSHSSSSLLSVCKDGIFLNKGLVEKKGEINEIIRFYENNLYHTDNGIARHKYLKKRKAVHETNGLDIEGIHFVNEKDEEVEELITGEDFKLVIKGYAWKKTEDIGINILIRSSLDDSNVFIDLSSAREGKLYVADKGEFNLILSIQKCVLAAGNYTAKINLNHNGIYIFDGIENYNFLVKDINKLAINSSFYLNRNWDS